MMYNLHPYPAYKDSGVPWMGQVPEHWDVAAVRRYCRVFAGATPSRAIPEYWRGGLIPWLASGDINLRRITGARQYITEAGFAASSTKWIRPRSLVLALAGQGRTKGMVATVECRITCNQSLAAIEPSANTTDYRFLAYYLESRYLHLRALVGDGLRDGLNLEHVRAIVTPLPPLPEQAAIVRFLDRADRQIRRYIRAKQKLIKLLEEQKQAIIQRAVTRGLPAEAAAKAGLDPNVRLKPSGVEWLGDVPEHWEVRAARWFFREVDERSETGSEELLSVSHITGVTPRSEKNITMFMAASNAGHKLCRPGDLVINTMWAWMAALGVARQTGIVSPSYAVYRPHLSSRLLGEYADLLLRTAPYKSEYICRSTGIRLSRLRLYPDEFLRIKLLCPPPEEQRTVLDIVGKETADTRRAIDVAHGEIALLREYRTRLIGDVVTGKLDVREAAAQLPDEVGEPEALDEADTLTDAGEDVADDIETVPKEAEE